MYRRGRSNDVIVRVVPGIRRGRERAADDLAQQVYDVLLYSRLPLPTELPSDTQYAREMQELPLVGVERIRLAMGDYQRILATFIEGERGVALTRERLLESMSPALRKVLTEAPLDMCVWWSHATPELEEFPWELAGDPGGQSGHRLVFVRGVPPENPLPAIPIVNQPRMAALGCANDPPDWAARLMGGFPQHVRIIDGPIRHGLETAVAEGCELVHVFTDGLASGALEGILYDRTAGSDAPQLHPGDVSRILSGTRVALLALSPAHEHNPEAMTLGGRQVLSAYRAFAYLGASTLPLPSIIAPLGPLPGDLMLRFWERFYSELFDQWHLTTSLQLAQKSLPFPAPIALFCRHAGGKIFRRVSAEEPSYQPVQAQADLLRSQRLTTNLAAFNEKWGDADLPDAVRKLLQEEQDHQTHLEGELHTWIDAEEEL
ncbi:MAG: hypothetical protein ABI818_07265 [Acidobacteriota bacterium]